MQRCEQFYINGQWVDPVERRTLEAPAIGLSVPFPLDDSIQHRFLEGLDDIGLTLQKADDITRYESSRPDWLPTA